MQKIPLPGWYLLLAHLLPLSLLVVFATTSLVDPDTMRVWLMRDDDERGVGLIENLTVLFLIPGILAGLYAFVRFRKLMQPWWTAFWLLAWSLACIYFAGEEASWGQWYFNWDTPEAFTAINDQDETNFHNTSSWFDQKPRALVELFIFVTGFIMPLIGLIRSRLSQWQPSNSWLLPVTPLVTAAFFFTLLRFGELVPIKEISHLLASSETRELSIALFLSLFLISYPLRLSKLKP